MYTSPLASTPARCTCTALTVIVLIDPTTSVRVCSFSVIVATPGTDKGVLGAGFTGSGPRPLMLALVSVVDPTEPSPFEVHALATASPVTSPASTLTLTALAL